MNSSRLSSPPSKRVKLESHSPRLEDSSTQKTVKNEPVDDEEASQYDEDENVENAEDENNCSICLQGFVDRAVVPTCSHEFCFECLNVWTEQSRRCPLCSQNIGEYLIHSIRSRYDYRKYYLTPLRKPSPSPVPALRNARQHVRRHRRERVWGRRREEDRTEQDRLELSIAKRRWIYQYDLYAKHVASNAYTKYRPYPTPAQFATSQELISRTTTFLRRELQVWEGLDVEFLTTIIISLMKSIDIRSESAVKLLSEFLDMDAPYQPGGRHINAEHFAHEVYCYVRSPFRDLFVYDTVVQYDTPSDIPPPPQPRQATRWQRTSYSRSRSHSQHRSPRQDVRRRDHVRTRSRSRSRSLSRSSSDKRRYPSTRDVHMEYPTDARSPPSPPPSQTHGSPDHGGKLEHGDFRRENGCVDGSVIRKTSKCSSPTQYHQRTPRALSPAEEAIPTERTIDPTGKGKRKADDPYLTNNVFESTTEIYPAQLDDEEMLTARRRLPSSGEHIDSQRQSIRSRAPLRPPRNRSLRDSVQAHLAFPQAGGKKINEYSKLEGQTSYVNTPKDVSTAGTSEEMAVLSHPYSHSKPSLLPCLSSPTLCPNSIHAQVQKSIHRQPSTSASASISTPDISHLDVRGDNHLDTQTRLTVPKYSCASRVVQAGSDDESSLQHTSAASLPATELREQQRRRSPSSPLSNGLQDTSPLFNSQVKTPVEAEYGATSELLSKVAHSTLSRSSDSISTHDRAAVEVRRGARQGENPDKYGSARHWSISISGLKSDDVLSQARPKHAFHHVRSPTPSSITDIPIQNDYPHISGSNLAISDPSHHSTFASALDLRTRLLARLEKEKGQAQARDVPGVEVEYSHSESVSPSADSPVKSTTMLDRSSLRFASTRRSSSPDTSHRLLDDSSPDIVDSTARATEVRLRARAQLKVRLASEKRLGGFK